jgi:hypothetical protein
MTDELTVLISRRAGWSVLWVVFATMIRAYLDGSKTIQFTISSDE